MEHGLSKELMAVNEALDVLTSGQEHKYDDATVFTFLTTKEDLSRRTSSRCVILLG